MRKNAHILIIIVASLGYFVDIYDITLFGIVKQESLENILPNATDDEITNAGFLLFNMQMIGMLIGGLLWGILGDKKGRLKVLFGSILLYSLANIANAFVDSVSMYAVTRLVAGIGLAGELGAGITLVSEMMSKEKRGYGTMIIVTFGALGAVTAELINRNGKNIATFFHDITGATFQSWQVVYIIGGLMGLMLLALRIGTMESEMFKQTKNQKVKKGDIGILFRKNNFGKYVKCILVGVPIWYVIGLLVFQSQKIFAIELGVEGEMINGKETTVINGTAIMYAYLGLSAGDLMSGLLSQLLKSRKKVVIIYLLFTFFLVTYFIFFCQGISVDTYYLLSFLLGVSTGYWALFVTIAAEQFGTNIRSTVANTVPNFVRGSVPLISSLFGMLTAISMEKLSAAYLVGILCIGLALWAIFSLKETFAKDLDYLETNEVS